MSDLKRNVYCHIISCVNNAGTKKKDDKMYRYETNICTNLFVTKIVYDQPFRLTHE